MANARKGLLTPPPQWRKHLKDWKRVFWKRERRAGRGEAARRKMKVLFVALVGPSLTIGIDLAAAAADTANSGAGSGSIACPATTDAQKLATARAWHEDVINRRNPASIRDILAPDVVHHAAGGYPDVTSAEGVATMMNDFLGTFPDLRYTFDRLIVRDDDVVERYTATGTQEGQFGRLAPSGRRATWTGINIFRIQCGRIAEVWSEVDALGRDQQLTGATSPR